MQRKIKILFLMLMAVFVFSPFSSLAQEPIGTCTFPVTGTVAPGYTLAQCNAENGTWVAYQTQPQEPVGRCTYPRGTIVSGYTKSQCDSENGTWAADNNTGIPISTGSASPGAGTDTTTTTSTSTTAATDEKGLVPCDNVTTKCDFEQFMKLINNVIDFIFKILVVPIAAIMFAYAGFLLVTAGGGEAKTKAKKIFTDAVIGLILAAAAWLIVKTLLSILGYKFTGTYFFI